MPSDEVRAAIMRGLKLQSAGVVRPNDVHYALASFAEQLDALTAEESGVRMMAKAAYNEIATRNDPKWDTLTHNSQKHWTRAIRAAIRTLAEACK